METQPWAVSGGSDGAIGALLCFCPFTVNDFYSQRREHISLLRLAESRTSLRLRSWNKTRQLRPAAHSAQQQPLEHWMLPYGISAACQTEYEVLEIEQFYFIPFSLRLFCPNKEIIFDNVLRCDKPGIQCWKFIIENFTASLFWLPHIRPPYKLYTVLCKSMGTTSQIHVVVDFLSENN